MAKFCYTLAQAIQGAQVNFAFARFFGYLKLLTRFKGIETYLLLRLVARFLYLKLLTRFKGIETDYKKRLHRCHNPTRFDLKLLTRFKGIETYTLAQAIQNAQNLKLLTRFNGIETFYPVWANVTPFAPI